MSVKVSSWVWHECPVQLRSSELVVLLALADVANDRGECVFFQDPSEGRQEALAAKARMSVATWRRVTEELAGKRLLTVRREKHYGANAYRIEMDSAQNERWNSAHSGEEQRSFSGDQRSTVSGHKDVDVEDVINAQFDAFWAVYPRHVGKAAARAKFGRVVRETDAAVVVEGARRFAADPNLPEKQFIPHPTTWLSQGRWEDEPLPERLSDPEPVVEPSSAVGLAAVPWWLAVLRIPVEDFMERRGDAAWVSEMEALAEKRRAG